MTIEEFDFEQYYEDIFKVCPFIESEQKTTIEYGDQEITLDMSFEVAVDSIPALIASETVKLDKYKNIDEKMLEKATKILFDTIPEKDKSLIYSKIYK